MLDRPASGSQTQGVAVRRQPGGYGTTVRESRPQRKSQGGAARDGHERPATMPVPSASYGWPTPAADVMSAGRPAAHRAIPRTLISSADDQPSRRTTSAAAAPAAGRR